MKQMLKRRIIMDIKKTIEDLVKKVNTDASFASEFEKNPVKAIEKATGLDLPDEQLNAVIDGVKAKIKLDDIGDVIGGLLGKK